MYTLVYIHWLSCTNIHVYTGIRVYSGTHAYTGIHVYTGTNAYTVIREYSGIHVYSGIQSRFKKSVNEKTPNHAELNLEQHQLYTGEYNRQIRAQFRITPTPYR